MPTWLVPTLKWGGIGLAIISAIALIYVQNSGASSGPEREKRWTTRRSRFTGSCW